jgi:cyclin-dependent kinase regulatory subunit CKS1
MKKIPRLFLLTAALNLATAPFLVANENVPQRAQQATDFFTIEDPVQKDAARREIARFQINIIYSEKYVDADNIEYRHVSLPKELKKYVPRNRLMTEPEWRQLGVQQSVGWIHFMIYPPELHILLFKRPVADQG